MIYFIKKFNRFLPIAITAFFLFLVTFYCGADPISKEKAETIPVKKEHLEKKLKKFPNGPVPKPIGVSVYLIDLLHVNEAERYFEGVVEIISHWEDERLAFNGLNEGLNKKVYLFEEAEVEREKIWTPQIDIKNLIPQNAIINRSLTILENGHVIEHQMVYGKFQTIFHTKSFPFDEQRLPLQISTERFSTYEIDLIQEFNDEMRTGVNDKLSIKGWKAREDLIVTKDIFKGVDDDFYPSIKIEIPINRNPWPVIVSSLLPFFLILSAPTLMLFVLKADIAPLMASILTSILAMVALSFSSSLRLSFLEYNNLVSQCFNIGFAYQFTMLFLGATIFNVKFSQKIMDKFIKEEFIHFFSWFLPLLLIGSVFLRVLLAKYNLDFMDIDTF